VRVLKGSLSTVDKIIIMVELGPLNTEVPVAVEVTVTKVDRGSMYAGTLWVCERE